MERYFLVGDEAALTSLGHYFDDLVQDWSTPIDNALETLQP